MTADLASGLKSDLGPIPAEPGQEAIERLRQVLRSYREFRELRSRLVRQVRVLRGGVSPSMSPAWPLGTPQHYAVRHRLDVAIDHPCRS